MPRRLLTDAAIALALVLVTVGPGLVTGLATVGKPGDPAGLLERSGLPVGAAWWLLVGLIVAGVVIRRQRPLTALVLTGLGTFGHLVTQTKFQLIDLALPLVMYSVAAMARRRRVALVVLGVVMVLSYAAMFGGRLMDQRQAARNAKQAEQEVVRNGGDRPVIKTVRVTAPPWIDVVVDTSQAVLEMWLLLIAAFAVGDGMRSRRAHLAAVEERTADLAREQRQRAALAVATERARITRELHDVVAHGMSVMVVQAQGAAAALDRHPERTATALQHVITTGRSSLEEMRRLLAAGRTETATDPQLTPQPGIGTVPALVDRLRSAGMRIELHIDGVPEVIPAAVDLSAYRVVQEALTNTLKHGGDGVGARVRLEFVADCLRVEVVDDGAGRVEGADGRGQGLRGIAERVAVLGGALEAGHGPGCGFRLVATLPLGARR
ncbi:sensor histidine kinase [Paractinoplanes maris]|uniref:sensor histidine kinase n=1 Tax=Paractinoplanes maris TaxID=1734446 RepID=UPI0020206EC5|nr:histidine kinase [Actinoplanes maris]